MAGLSDWVQGIRVDSAYLPPIIIDNPLAPGAPNPVLSALKPKITITLAHGLNPVTVAPWGDPGATKWPALRAGLLIAGFGAALFIVSAFKRRRRRMHA